MPAYENNEPRPRWRGWFVKTTPSNQTTRTIATMLPREIGRYIPACSGLACWTWGWSSGTRSKASGRTAVWAGSIRTRFLCRSRLIHPTLGVLQKPPQGSSIWLCGEPISTGPKSHLDSYPMPGTDRERDCSVRRIPKPRARAMIGCIEAASGLSRGKGTGLEVGRHA